MIPIPMALVIDFTIRARIGLDMGRFNNRIANTIVTMRSQRSRWKKGWKLNLLYKNAPTNRLMRIMAKEVPKAAPIKPKRGIRSTSVTAENRANKIIDMVATR